MMLYTVLLAYLRIFSKPRHENHNAVPDGSDLLNCLAYGFSKLLEDLRREGDILLSTNTMELMDELDTRLAQVAYSSKHWTSDQEWESVHMFTWKIIEELGLKREDVNDERSDSGTE